METVDSDACAPSFDLKLAFKGKSSLLRGITTETTVAELVQNARDSFNLEDDVSLKFLYKGKVLGTGGGGGSINVDAPAFPDGIHPGKGKASVAPAKIMVMATSAKATSELNSKRSDPTIRGFHNEKQPARIEESIRHWGPQSAQNKQYKFCRFQACTWQSFGHRTGSTTPHAFKAMQLLERLATDPGIVAVMVERELVVGTLGEMDPIDDRIMQKMQQNGACLLGYNTNAGARIDVKLRTDDLKQFRPYDDIAATLIHELSHNWVGEHNALFWTNYGQMRVEYLHRHASLAASGYVVNGQTTATVAGVADCQDGMRSILRSVLEELRREMAKHGIPVEAIAPAIVQRCEQLAAEEGGSERGRALGGGSELNEAGQEVTSVSTRGLALAAAERRRQDASLEEHRRQKHRDGDEKGKSP